MSKFAGLTNEELLDMEILGFYALKGNGLTWRAHDRAGYDRRLALWREVKREIAARKLAEGTVLKDRDTGR